MHIPASVRRANAAARLADGKKKTTVVREGGGQVWEDPTLLDWDPKHFRIFVGDLGGEVTDEALLRAFAQYPSVQRARNVRDARTAQSRGYGFVSFAEPNDFVRALREMQGKYIGSRPVKLRRAEANVDATRISESSLRRREQNAPYSRLLSTSKAKSGSSSGAAGFKKASRSARSQPLRPRTLDEL